MTLSSCRMALSGREAGAAQRHALVERHVVADLGRLAHHDARAVVDEEAAPIFAAGWISIPVSARVAVASTRGATGTRASCRRWATRWLSSACTPGQAARISAGPTSRAAGSRSRAAPTSRRTSVMTRPRTSSPNTRQRLQRTRERPGGVGGRRGHASWNRPTSTKAKQARTEMRNRMPLKRRAPGGCRAERRRRTGQRAAVRHRRSRSRARRWGPRRATSARCMASGPTTGPCRGARGAARSEALHSHCGDHARRRAALLPVPPWIVAVPARPRSMSVPPRDRWKVTGITAPSEATRYTRSAATPKLTLSSKIGRLTAENRSEAVRRRTPPRRWERGRRGRAGRASNRRAHRRRGLDPVDPGLDAQTGIGWTRAAVAGDHQRDVASEGERCRRSHPPPAAGAAERRRRAPCGDRESARDRQRHQIRGLGVVPRHIRHVGPVGGDARHQHENVGHEPEREKRPRPPSDRRRRMLSTTAPTMTAWVAAEPRSVLRGRASCPAPAPRTAGAKPSNQAARR